MKLSISLQNFISGCTCESIYLDNKWTSGIFSRSDTLVNGKYYWSDSNSYSIWYDGQFGLQFDWIFGAISDLGSSSQGVALMHSDEETICPHEVTKWTKDIQAIVTCGKFNLIYFKIDLFFGNVSDLRISWTKLTS